MAAEYLDGKGGRHQPRAVAPGPVLLGQGLQTLAAWCELRQDYRSLRIDRFVTLDLLRDSIPDSADITPAGLPAHINRDGGDCRWSNGEEQDAKKEQQGREGEPF